MSHTGLYPRRPYTLNPKPFMLAHIEGSEVLLENGCTIDFRDSWGHLYYLLTTLGLLCFTEQLDPRTYPWVEDAYQDKRSTPTPGRITGIQVRDKKRRTYYLIPSATWGVPSPSVVFVQDMRLLAESTGLVKATPGALGAYLMARPWYDHEEKHLDQVAGLDYYSEEYWEPKQQHSYPGKAAREDIKRYTIGARVEKFSKVKGDHTRYDLSAAFASHTGRLPTGTTCRTTGDRGTGKLPCFTAFTACTVTIHHELDVAVFGIRDGGAITWPTAPGTYYPWLWSEQVDDCRLAGCTVEIGEGWYWRESTEDLQEWQDLMSDMMEKAPNDRVRALLKLARNAAIGNMGIGDGKTRVLKTGDTPRKGDRPLMGPFGHTGLYTRREESSARKTMVHWWAYTLAMVQRTVYWAMLRCVELGAEVVAVLTDCIVLREELEWMSTQDGWRMI